MSRAQKIHPPLKASFNNILRTVAAGTGQIKGPTKPAETDNKKLSTKKGKKK